MADTAEFWDFTPLIPQLLEDITRDHQLRYETMHVWKLRTDDGIWQRRNWRGIPGICFTGETDNCLTGRVEAPANVLYDENGCEFVFRQPRNEVELRSVLRAMAVEPFDQYGFDGHHRWDLASIRQWWQSRKELAAWICEKERNLDLFRDQEDAMRAYEFHLLCEAETYLRTFAFFVDVGRCATTDDRLPELE